MPRHIYFDYEAWNKLEDGHTPNMVVAQYAKGKEVRSPRDIQPLDDYKKTAKDFGKWLFSEQHQRCTIFAHYFRWYDGYFVIKHMLDNHLKGIKVIQRATQLLELQYP